MMNRVLKIEFDSFIKDFDFECFATVVVSGEDVRFEMNCKDRLEQGWVYLWTADRPDRFIDIMYAGKAGMTFQKRCQEHQGGFKNPNPNHVGRRHKARIQETAREGGELRVYARLSAREKVLGEEVSICDVEESALKKKFEPPWNQNQVIAGARAPY